MTTGQEKIYEKLLAERERLRRMIDLEEGERFELLATGSEGDEADRSLIANLREYTITRVDLDRQRLRLVEDALARLEQGEYGDCLHCGEPISPKRLAAIPWAQYCVRCQELKEQGLLQEEEALESL